MRVIDEKLAYTTSDLVNFSRCSYLTFMDNRAAFDFALASQKVDPSDYIEMIQENGRKHELNCWNNLHKEVSTFIEISQHLSSTERADKTIKAMKDGIEIFFQGGFIFEDFVARPDFLVKTHSP